jgi:hypothetical protein
MLGIFLVLAICGAILDRKYKERGGLKPDWSERRPYLIAGGVCLGLMVFLGIRGGTAEAEADLAVFFGTLVFGLWEFGRWRIRRKNPVIAAITTGCTVENPVGSTEITSSEEDKS